MSKVLYVVSVLILFVLATIVKKKDDKVNFLTVFFIEVVLLSCYNIAVCMLLRVFNISITLLPLTLINLIPIMAIIYKIVKDKSLQKYYVEIKDIIAVICITIAGLAVVYVNFGLPMNISFVEVDISNHYDMITSFYQTGNISIGSIPGAYINYGLFFKVFFNPIQRFDGYYLIMICEIIKLIFSGVLFYLGIKTFIKKKLSYVIIVLLSIIYMLSYPLNGMLCGFVYHQMAINIVSVILIIMINYNDIERRLRNLLLFLLTFGLMYTYYILVPPVYLAIFIYELKNFKNDKVETIKNILEIFTIPAISGILHFLILPNIVNPQSTFNPAVHMGSKNAQDGYIFVSYYATFLLFIPFNIYYIVDKIRKKEDDFLSVILVMNILFCIIAVIGEYFGLIATYYVMKPYYMLWLIMLTITGITISDLLNSKIDILYKLLINIVFFTYVIGIIYSVFVKGPCDLKIFEMENENIGSMFNIYRINTGIVTHQNFEVLFTKDELQLLRKETENFSGNEKILFVQNVNNKEWVKKLLLIKGDNDNTIMAPIFDEEKEDKLIEMILNSEEKIYVITLEDSFIIEYFSGFINKLDNTLNEIAKEERMTIYTNK